MIVRRVLFFVLYGVVLLFCLATGSQVLYFVLAAMTGMLLLSLVSLLLVGEEEMLLPALGVIVLVLVLLRPRLDKQNSRAETSEEKEAAS